VTFRVRLTLMCSVALGLALAAVIAFAYLTDRDSLGSQLDSLLRARAGQVTPDVVQEVLAANGLLPKQSRVGQDAPTQPHTSALRGAALGFGLADLVLVTDRGEVAPASGAPLPSVAALNAAARTVAAGRVRVAFRTFSAEGARYRAYIFRAAPGIAGAVRAPLASLDAALRSLRLRFLLTAIAALLLGVILAALVARRAMRPVATLTAAAERVVDTGDLRARVQSEQGDRSELTRLAVTMNAMLAALERSVNSQRQLVADASHELRTPLTTLIANLQLLDEPGGLGADDAGELVARARAEAEGLAALVSELVELARDGQVELHLGEVRLDLVAGAALERVSRRSSHVGFDADLAPCTVRGDADLLDRAIGNLLENAAKWTPAGGRVELTVHDGEVIVRDDGPGISDTDLPLVFERFYRSRSARGQPGSGLGLAIVRQVAELHGGVAVAGNSERGASLRILLPTVAHTREG
jgi:two-component system sensor histidine kinase MprB